MAQFSIPTGLTVQPGDTLIVPIEIDDTSGLLSLSLSLIYDPSLLNVNFFDDPDPTDNVPPPADITLGDALTGLVPADITPPEDYEPIEANVNESAGTIDLTVIGLEPLEGGSGTAINIAFTAPVEASGTTTIDLVDAEINEGLISASVEGGDADIEITSTGVNLDLGGNGVSAEQSDALLLLGAALNVDSLINTFITDANALAPGTVTRTVEEVKNFVNDNLGQLDLGGNGVGAEQSDALLLLGAALNVDSLIDTFITDANALAPGTVTRTVAEVKSFVGASTS